MKTPRFKGKNFLFRKLFRQKIATKTDITVVGLDQCTYLLPNLTENVGFDIFVNGVYEPETAMVIASFLPHQGKLLDIGGNIGAIAVPLAKSRPDIHIVSIEASSRIYKYLCHNIESNQLANVKALNYAVYHEAGKWLDFYSPKEKYGKGSLASVFSDDPVPVWTVTVDGLVEEFMFESVHAIKVDVEGFEFFVFRGAEKTLSGPNAPAIIFEFVDWAERHAGLQPGDAQKLLMAYGYQIYRMEGTRKIRIDSVLTVGGYNLVAIKA